MSIHDRKRSSSHADSVDGQVTLTSWYFQFYKLSVGVARLISINFLSPQQIAPYFSRLASIKPRKDSFRKKTSTPWKRKLILIMLAKIFFRLSKGNTQSC